MRSEEAFKAVTPAEAGVQNLSNFLDSGFRRNDEKRRFRTFYEAVNLNAFVRSLDRPRAHVKCAPAFSEESAGKGDLYVNRSETVIARPQDLIRGPWQSPKGGGPFSPRILVAFLTFFANILFSLFIT